MSELKACPFCGKDNCKHLSVLRRENFSDEGWNTRPLESALQSALTTAQEENKRLVEAHKEICRRYHTITKNAKKWQLEADLACMYDFAQSALNGLECEG